MNRYTRHAIRVTACTLIGCAGLASAAGSYNIDWHTIDGGGGAPGLSTGGVFQLSGIIGQPDAGVTEMSGGNFSLTGGFWNGAVTPCPGDVDGDRFVGPQDLTLLLAAWYSKPGDPNWNPHADFDFDNFIGPQDLTILLANWYQSCQ